MPAPLAPPPQLTSVQAWQPSTNRQRPAYFTALDHRRRWGRAPAAAAPTLIAAHGARLTPPAPARLPHRRVIWAVRGTRNMHDVLTNAAGASLPVPGGHVHWGMHSAAHALLAEALPGVSQLLAAHPGYDLQLVGHSLGGGCAALMCHLLHTAPQLRAQLLGRPASCVGVSTPCVMSPGLAAAARAHTATLVLEDDIVPRLNVGNAARLRAELLAVDWWVLLPLLPSACPAPARCVWMACSLLARCGPRRGSAEEAQQPLLPPAPRAGMPRCAAAC